MPDFRRGVDAIKAAAESSKGNFSPFTPTITWGEDKEEKYVLFLTPVDEAPVVLLHRFVEIGEGKRSDDSTYTKYGFYISRKDPGIGEDYDLLEDRNGFTPSERCLGVAVELEPVMKTVSGRQKPKSFKVLTTEYERRIDPDDEESEKETVTAPVVGIVDQASGNFFGYLVSYNEDEGPVIETPFKVKRRGKDTKTEYDFLPYDEIEVDLSDLVQNVEGISYLSEASEELVEALDGAADDAECGAIIADFILSLRLDELSDKEKYDEEVTPLEDLEPKYGGKKDKKKNKRPERKSQRPSRRAKKEEPEEAGDDDADDGSAGDDAKVKQERFQEMRKKAAERRKKQAAAA